MDLKRFAIYWIFQSLSVLGSAMTRFAVPVWIFGRYGSASSVAIGAAMIAALRIISGPLAGVFVDRSQRKRVILMAEGGQALLIAGLLGLVSIAPEAGLVPVYLLLAVAGIFDTLHFPALVSAVPLMVEKQNLVRANGMISFTESLSELAAPFLAAILLARFSIGGVLAVDLASFVVAMIAVLFVRIPEVARPSVSAPRSSILEDLRDSFTYLSNTAQVRSLLYLSVVGNFFITGAFVLLSPMVLASSNNNTYLLSLLLACGNAAQVGVSLFTASFPTQDTERKIYSGYIVLGFLGAVLIGLTAQPWVWGIGLLFFMGVIPGINACSRAIWQATIPQEQQGRFFASKRSLSHSVTPIAMALSGLWVDQMLIPVFGNENVLGYRIAFVAFGIVLGLLGIKSLLAYRCSSGTLPSPCEPSKRLVRR